MKEAPTTVPDAVIGPVEDLNLTTTTERTKLAGSALRNLPDADNNLDCKAKHWKQVTSWNKGQFPELA